jgi:tetratricopeptide (TPR) repeat protein
MFGLCSCATPSNIEVLQRGVEERPEDFKAHLELARAYLERGVRWEVAPGVGVPILTSKRWLKKAQRELERASGLDPLSPEPHYWLKIIYTARGKYREADEEAALYSSLTVRKKRRESSP